MDELFSVLIVGCKKHEQIAERSFKLIKKFWPEILDKIYFCTDETTEFQKKFTNNVICGKNNDFSNRIQTGLENIKSDYVLLLLDDYYFTKSVNNFDFNNLLTDIKRNNISYCKLIGLPRCFKKDKRIAKTYSITNKTHYGVSLQPSIWKKSALYSALSFVSGSSPWEVEAAFNKFQKNNYSSCVTFNSNFLNIKNGVLRGKLAPGTNNVLKKNDIETLTLDNVNVFKYNLFMFKQHVAMHLPVFLRSLGKRIGILFGKKYFSEN